MLLGRRLELAVIACLIKLVSIVVDRAKAKRTIRQHVGKSVAAPSVRLLGASGAAANVGLLQVRVHGSSNDEFGSVCGMNLVRLFSNRLLIRVFPCDEDPNNAGSRGRRVLANGLRFWLPGFFAVWSLWW